MHPDEEKEKGWIGHTLGKPKTIPTREEKTRETQKQLQEVNRERKKRKYMWMKLEMAAQERGASKASYFPLLNLCIAKLIVS